MRSAVQIAALTPHPSRPSREIGAIHLPLEGEGVGLSPFLVSAVQNLWLVRQDGTVISPVPGKEKAIDFAKAYHISTQIMSKEEYTRHFGKELTW